MKILASLLFLTAVVLSPADEVIINFQSPELRDHANVPLVDGRLVLLIANVGSANTAGTGFSTLTAGNLNVGDYLNGGLYQIIMRAQIDSSWDGPGTFIDSAAHIPLQQNPFPNLSTGDQLAVVWFSNLNYATSYSSSANLPYGLYSLSAWQVPSPGFIPDFSVPAGTVASYLTLSAIPEPSTYAIIFGALALGLAAYRQRSR
ncbi:hypothetical protein [Oleiharenicola lentus]|uniref:hypothetical protein n=1 Tax=Oleiharenicola lentus TaxID=2508720 RepID=UPI003F668E15